MFKHLKLKYKLAIYSTFALGISLICMGIAMYFMSKQQDLLIQVERQYRKMETQKKIAEKEVELAQAAKKIMIESKGAGLSPSHWTEMRINVRQKKMTRGELNKLLVEATRAKGNLFGAEKFDISVSNADDNLFDANADKNQEVLVSLQGKTLVKSDAKAGVQ